MSTIAFEPHCPATIVAGGCIIDGPILPDQKPPAAAGEAKNPTAIPWEVVCPAGDGIEPAECVPDGAQAASALGPIRDILFVAELMLKFINFAAKYNAEYAASHPDFPLNPNAEGY